MKQSKFLTNATFRIKNKKWLRYSSNIARRILSALEESDTIDRNVLAEKLGVSKQYVSKLVQGNENLSLQTIANLSDALGVELISFPLYKDSYVRSTKISISDYTHFYEMNFLFGTNSYLNTKVDGTKIQGGQVVSMNPSKYQEVNN